MKKGFTLVEMLAVIIILALLGFITIVVVQGVIDKGSDKALSAKLNELKSATESYIRTEGEPSWCKNKTTCFISIRLLAYKKYIKLDENNKFINPKTGDSFQLEMVTMVKKYGNNYKFEALEDYESLNETYSAYLNQAKKDALASSALIYKLKGLCNSTCSIKTTSLENQNLIEKNFYENVNISINSNNEISIN